MIINLPKLGPVRFDDNLSTEQFHAQLNALQQKYDFQLPKPDVGIGTLLKQGFMRSMGETGIALGDVIPAMGASALGFDDYAKKQMGEAAASREQLQQKYPTQFNSYKEVSSPYEALQYGAETLGELAPTALTAMIPGVGAEALGARVAARGAMGAAMEAGPLTEAAMAAAQTGAKKAAETVGRRAMYGGVYLGSLAQNAPEIFQNIYDETGKMEPGIAALAGGISSVLDTIVPGDVMDQLGKYGKMKAIAEIAKESGAAPKVWKYMLGSAAKDAAMEGLTESAQEIIGATAEKVAGSSKDVFSPENIQRYKENFVKGAIGGAGFGVLGGFGEGARAKHEYRNYQEAEDFVKQLRAKEEAAGTLTPEKAAHYDEQIEGYRTQRQADLEAAFEGLPDFAQRQEEMKALQARMDEARPGSKAYKDLTADLQKMRDDAEAARNKQLEEEQKADAEKVAGSAFAKAEPTPGTGGMFKPGLEQQRGEQQSATRQFAFGDTASALAGDPVTVDTLKNLSISDRSTTGISLLGTDLDTVDGRRKFIQTLENPSFTGKINEEAYDAIVSTFDPKEVVAHRAEMQAENISPTKQKQQQQTRQFAFGEPDVTGTNTTPSGASPDVAGQSETGTVPKRSKKSERSGLASTTESTDNTATGEGQQSSALNENAPTTENTTANVTPATENTSTTETSTTPPTNTTSENLNTNGTQTSETQQTETQRQEAPATGVTTETPTPRGVTARPDLSAELGVIRQKLGVAKSKLTGIAKDAHAYFSKVVPELALDAIANDLVYQPTAYRNSNMTLPSVTTPGTFAPTPEPTFHLAEESKFHAGQGGVHAKNAAAWARANLSPEAVAFMDSKIAQYQKEAERSSKSRKKLDKQQALSKATGVQVAEESKAAKEEGDYAPTLQELEEAKGTKTLAGKRKKNLQKLANELSSDADLYGSFDDVVDTDTGGILPADENAAALHSSAHPVTLHQLENNNLVGALNALADNASSDFAKFFARILSKVVGNVNLVYGAERSMYDPKTNTIYLRDGASEYEILHESAHAALSHTLDNASHPITRQIKTLFEAMKKGTEGTYGAKDIQEFVAEAWSNEDFRNQLKEFKPTGEKFTGWEKFMKAIRQFFGLKTKPEHTTALDALDRMLNEIVSPPPETRTGETLYAQAATKPNIAQETLARMETVMRRQPVMNSERVVGFWKGLEKVNAFGRLAMYKTLNLSALGEIGTRIFGENSKLFANRINEMEGYKEHLMEAMAPLHRRLQEFQSSERYQAWSDLVDAATIPDIRPYDEARSRYIGTGKFAEYEALNKRWKQLTPDEQKLYKDLFATYKALDGEFIKSLEKNIKGTVDDPGKALSAYQKILQELSTVRIDHYAPLYREGPFWLQYDVNGVTEKKAFSSQAERNFARQQLQTSGATNFDEYSRVQQINSKNIPDGTMLASIMDIMKKAGAGEEDLNKLIQLIVQSLPETSILKSRQNRTGIGGYIQNASYVFDRVSSNSARQLARMRYAPEIKNLLTKMGEDANTMRGQEQIYAIELHKEFAQRGQFAITPNLSNWSQTASSSAFYFNLAGNASTALIQVVQTPMVTFPHLGGVYGWGKAKDAMFKAFKLYKESGLSRNVAELGGDVSQQKAMLSIENAVNNGKAPQYKALIEAMKLHGLLQTSTARDALSSVNNDKSAYGGVSKIQRVTTLVSSFMFHHAERMGREITGVAAYDLEMDRLKSKGITGEEAQKQAIAKAIYTVEYTHGAGSTAAGPSIAQSDIGRTLMVFKRYAFSMYHMLFDTMLRALPVKGAAGEQLEQIKAARRQLLGIYGMSALFSGIKGLPLYWIMQMAYDAVKDKDDDDFDTVMRRYIHEFAFKGPVNYVSNLDLASRVGWTDLLWRENKGAKADAGVMQQFAEAAFGAPWSMGDSMYRGYKLIQEGNIERGIETILPVSIRNIFKGSRYALQGANTLRGDPVMGDINGYNAAMQVLGFAPADLMKQYEENAYITNKAKTIHKEENDLLRQYYVALHENDYDRMQARRADLMKLGAKYPELGINDAFLSKSVAARDRITSQMYHGVQVDQKLKERLRGAAATAYE